VCSVAEIDHRRTLKHTEHTAAQLSVCVTRERERERERERVCVSTRVVRQRDRLLF